MAGLPPFSCKPDILKERARLHAPIQLPRNATASPPAITEVVRWPLTPCTRP